MQNLDKLKEHASYTSYYHDAVRHVAINTSSANVNFTLLSARAEICRTAQLHLLTGYINDTTMKLVK